MRQQIFEGDLALCGDIVVERTVRCAQNAHVGELWRPTGYRIAQRNPTFLQQHERCRRSDGLRHGRDTKQSVALNRKPVVKVTTTECSTMYHFAIAPDERGCPSNRTRFDGCGHGGSD